MNLSKIFGILTIVLTGIAFYCDYLFDTEIMNIVFMTWLSILFGILLFLIINKTKEQAKSPTLQEFEE